MLTVYMHPSCTSCRKTKKWLCANNIAFHERHLFRETPTREELLHLLSLTTEGIDEILATRSQSFKQLGENVEDWPLSKVVELLVKEPRLLRRPIVTDGKRLVVGYNPSALKNIAKKYRRVCVS
ncbi:glutaredoxin family protein [Anoxybacillus flavithermus NBRC 109594]|uniref:Glutaredoxin family protein n=1 Tax=Anoxybacillus flavithermus NBRC 109594 TaxID=1315967 RepID=R4FZB3_9BACL|nr:Spx/MgsR family RNA polymerase-binding regulatory protein [Anoxybacillus flavithermus]GAC89664.1 glutaredoxin family protein [Anoxybacillus flavithermus NBRC 109594]